MSFNCSFTASICCPDLGKCSEKEGNISTGRTGWAWALITKKKNTSPLETPQPKKAYAEGCRGRGTTQSFSNQALCPHCSFLTFITTSSFTSLLSSFSPPPAHEHPSICHVPRQQSQQTVTWAGAPLLAAGRDSSFLWAHFFFFSSCSAAVQPTAWETTGQHGQNYTESLFPYTAPKGGLRLHRGLGWQGQDLCMESLASLRKK